MSKRPISSSSFFASERASREETVDLPTPPFPDKITTLFFTSCRQLAILATSGSGPVSPKRVLYSHYYAHVWTKITLILVLIQINKNSTQTHKYFYSDSLHMQMPCQPFLFLPDSFLFHSFLTRYLIIKHYNLCCFMYLFFIRGTVNYFLCKVRLDTFAKDVFKLGDGLLHLSFNSFIVIFQKFREELRRGLLQKCLAVVSELINQIIKAVERGKAHFSIFVSRFKQQSVVQWSPESIVTDSSRGVRNTRNLDKL